MIQNDSYYVATLILIPLNQSVLLLDPRLKLGINNISDVPYAAAFSEIFYFLDSVLNLMDQGVELAPGA